MKIYKGITYARYRRFAEAVEEEFIPGVSEHIDQGCLCPQAESRLSSLMKSRKESILMEEGRLCLSIYVPESTGGKVPVMVWIHGGAYLCGGSEDPRYSADRLVEKGNVIVVRISYRLGALGYLWLPEKGIANLGLKDQQIALRWIKRNISHFGGDPDNITLFGQSAGAHSIASLIAVSEDKLPFRRALLQSAPLGITITPKEASRITRAFLKALGKDIYEAGIDEILRAQKAVSKMKSGMVFMPVIEDNTAFPEGLENSGFKLICGYNEQDSAIFVQLALGKKFSHILGKALEKWLTPRIFSRPARRYCEKLQSRGVEAGCYSIGWHPEGNSLGACHCIELPFLFGELKDWVAADMMQGLKREEFESGSEKLLGIWTQFAHDGSFPCGKIL